MKCQMLISQSRFSLDQSTECVQSNPPPNIVSGSTVTPSIRKSSRICRPPNRYAPHRDSLIIVFNYGNDFCNYRH